MKKRRLESAAFLLFSFPFSLVEKRKMKIRTKKYNNYLLQIRLVARQVFFYNTSEVLGIICNKTNEGRNGAVFYRRSGFDRRVFSRHSGGV
jgi:hypothetical protein